MATYLLRRVLLAIPLLLGVVTLIFVLVELFSGDAADKYFTPETPPEVRQMIVEKWGLDKPAWYRYGLMIKNLASGDFGRSIAKEEPVLQLIKRALGNSLVLSVTTLFMLYLTGILIGTIQAVRQYSATDNFLSGLSLFLYSMPSFWLGLMLMLVFALWLGWLPSSGMTDPVEHDYMTPLKKLFDYAKHLLLPGVALGIAYAGGIARYMRSSLLEVIGQDYVRTARAKGLVERKVIFKHAMRNALIPIITLLGLSLPILFSGTVVIESIFAWPGMGRLILQAIFTQDLPVIIGCFFFFTVLVVIGNLVADILYSIVDPRIRFS